MRLLILKLFPKQYFHSPQKVNFLDFRVCLFQFPAILLSSQCWLSVETKNAAASIRISHSRFINFVSCSTHRTNLVGKKAGMPGPPLRGLVLERNKCNKCSHVSVRCKKLGCYAHARTSLHLTSINNFSLSTDHRTLFWLICIINDDEAKSNSTQLCFKLELLAVIPVVKYLEVVYMVMG